MVERNQPPDSQKFNNVNNALIFGFFNARPALHRVCAAKV
jgi:hypothetical protein